MDSHVGDFVRMLVLTFLTRVIMRSPVDTGRFRASWRVGNVAPDTSVAAPGGGGGDPTQSALKNFDARKTTDLIFITNSLPYAIRLEEGWSGQAPSGMVAITTAEMIAEIQSLR